MKSKENSARRTQLEIWKKEKQNLKTNRSPKRFAFGSKCSPKRLNTQQPLSTIEGRVVNASPSSTAGTTTKSAAGPKPIVTVARKTYSGREHQSNVRSVKQTEEKKVKDKDVGLLSKKPSHTTALYKPTKQTLENDACKTTRKGRRSLSHIHRTSPKKRLATVDKAGQMKNSNQLSVFERLTSKSTKQPKHAADVKKTAGLKSSSSKHSATRPNKQVKDKQIQDEDNSKNNKHLKVPVRKRKSSTVDKVLPENENKDNKKHIRRNSFIVAQGNRNNTPAVDKISREVSEATRGNEIARKVQFKSPVFIDTVSDKRTRSKSCGHRFGTPMKEATGRSNLDAWMHSRGHTPRQRHLSCMGLHDTSEASIYASGSSLVNQSLPVLSQSSDSLLGTETLSLQPQTSDSESPVNEFQCRFEDDQSVAMTTHQQAKGDSSHSVTGSSAAKRRKTWSDSPLLKSPLVVQRAMIEKDLSRVDSPLTRYKQADDVLEEINTLYETGYPTEKLLPWFEQVSTEYPDSIEKATFWICKIKLLQDVCDDDEILDIYEQAVRHQAKPADMMSESLRQFVVQMNERIHAKSEAAHTPGPKKRRLNHVQDDNVFSSSAIKLSVAEPTTFFKRIRSKFTLDANKLKAIVTPVRRSTRKSCTSLPRMLQDHDVVVESLDKLPRRIDKHNILFTPNKALLSDFDDVA